MLTPAEVQELEASLLPTRDRHHLRLLCHALRTLQAIANDAGLEPGQPPAIDVIHRWVARQAATANDGPFALAFSTQLERAAEQLRLIAAPLAVPPLALNLHQIVAWSEARVNPGSAGQLRSSP